MPPRQLVVVGVCSEPPIRANRLVSFSSATCPFRSSMMAASTPATLASSFARMLLSRLLWWILGSSTSGPMRRMLEVMTAMPRSLSNTGGFHSARTMSPQPFVFRRGSMPLVIFSPRVSVRRTWVSCVMPLARRVSPRALRMAASSGTPAKARAWAEARRRSRWRESISTPSGYTRRPSHTASPPCTTLSNTEIFACSRGNSSPFTCTWMSAFR